jgi:hypothetical protein
MHAVPVVHAIPVIDAAADLLEKYAFSFTE